MRAKISFNLIIEKQFQNITNCNIVNTTGKDPIVDQSVSSIHIRTSKVKKHWPWSVLGSVIPLDLSAKRLSVKDIRSLLICATIKWSVPRTCRQTPKVEEPYPLWKIKIVMACIQVILKGGSQSISNSPLRSSN